MTEQSKPMEEYNELVGRFVRLANGMKDEGKPIEMISAALMSASGIYATFVAAGNEGFLKTGGVNKITEVYRNNLLNVQRVKQAEAQAQGSSPSNETSLPSG